MDTEPGPGENRLAAGAGAAVIRASDGDREAAPAEPGGRRRKAHAPGVQRAPGPGLCCAHARRTGRLTACLPAIGPGSGPGRLRKVMLGIFWGSRRAGPQPLEDEITAIALPGDAVIDLRGAKATSKEITIGACALLNDVDVIIPEGIAVELSGVAAAGDNRNMTRPVPAGTGRFVVKIHGHAVLGDVQVLHSNPRAIRRRRSIED
jgi:hypothetical protein